MYLIIWTWICYPYPEMSMINSLSVFCVQHNPWEREIFEFLGNVFIRALSQTQLPKKIIICFNDSPSKMMKKSCFFHLKSSFLKVFKYLSQLFFEIYDITAWLTNNCNTHMINISWIKGNQTMKFGQLIEYN